MILVAVFDNLYKKKTIQSRPFSTVKVSYKLLTYFSHPPPSHVFSTLFFFLVDFSSLFSLMRELNSLTRKSTFHILVPHLCLTVKVTYNQGWYLFYVSIAQATSCAPYPSKNARRFTSQTLTPMSLYTDRVFHRRSIITLPRGTKKASDTVSRSVG